MRKSSSNKPRLLKSKLLRERVCGRDGVIILCLYIFQEQASMIWVFKVTKSSEPVRIALSYFLFSRLELDNRRVVSDWQLR